MSKVSFDGNAKLIQINLGETSIDVKTDLYSKWKLWAAEGDNLKYLPAFRSVGGDPTVNGKYLGSTFFIQNGWKIRPPSEDTFITIVGNLYADDGSNPFVPCLGDFNVVLSTTTSNLVDAVSTTPTSTNGIRKNVEFNNFSFIMISSADHITPISGRTVVAHRSIDGSAFSLCTNEVTEVGFGLYNINLSANDTNGNSITLRFSAQGADSRFISIITL